MSYLPVRNEAKELMNTLNPLAAKPEATPIIFASAIPHSKNLSGNFFAKPSVLVALDKSAPRTITLGLTPLQLIQYQSHL